MKKTIFFILAVVSFISCGNAPKVNNPNCTFTQVKDSAIVYFTSEITPQSLVKIYQAIGVQAQGNVAVKISTGEAGGHNYLKPELIGDLVGYVDGTIVECNTAYPGKRNSTKAHLKVIEDHGFNRIAKVDILDSEGEFAIPVLDDKWIKHDIVGSHLDNYDFMINLAHFKGHAMGGFGGVLKNASIGVASTDPVALDKACLDLVFGISPSEGDDNGPLLERIRERHGVRIVERGQENGLGTIVYKLVCID